MAPIKLVESRCWLRTVSLAIEPRLWSAANGFGNSNAGRDVESSRTAGSKDHPTRLRRSKRFGSITTARLIPFVGKSWQMDLTGVRPGYFKDKIVLVGGLCSR